MLIWIKR